MDESNTASIQKQVCQLFLDTDVSRHLFLTEEICGQKPDQIKIELVVVLRSNSHQEITVVNFTNPMLI
jgi:hypothetical protein